MTKRKQYWKKQQIAIAPSLSPGEIRRAEKRELVDPAQVDLGVFEIDPKYQELYLGCILRGEHLGITRVSLDRIQSGFTITKNDGSIEISRSPTPKESDIKWIVRKIRQGSRPTISLYKGDINDTAEFICSDDIVVLEAYRRLGLKKIPAWVYRPVSDFLEETLFTYFYVEALAGDKHYLKPLLQSHMLPTQPVYYSTFLGEKISVECNWDEDLMKLNDGLINALSRLRQFHLPTSTGDETHYHHCLASALCRASRIITSIHELIAQGLAEQGLILLRSLYELSLLTYLDWLCPEEFGEMMKHAAGNSPKNWSILTEKVEKELIEGGWTEYSAGEWKKSSRRCYEYVVNIKKRSSVTPLREKHDYLYQILSSMSHQDFTIGSAYTNILGVNSAPTEVKATHEIEDIIFILRYSDLAVGLICSCINNDTANV